LGTLFDVSLSRAGRCSPGNTVARHTAPYAHSRCGPWAEPCVRSTPSERRAACPATSCHSAGMWPRASPAPMPRTWCHTQHSDTH